MKQFKLLILLMVIGFVAEAQINYLPMNSRYRWIAGKADSTFHIPTGTTPSLRTGGHTGSGALFYKTSDSTVYVYTGTQWISVKGSGGGGSADSTIFATLYRLDTAKTNLRTSLNTKIDSLRRSGLNVQAYKNGSWVTMYTDSIGSGSADGKVDSVRFNRTTNILTVYQDIAADQAVHLPASYLNFDSSYTPLGGMRNDSTGIIKSVRIRRNSVTVTPTQIGDSAMYWDISVPTTYIDSIRRVGLNWQAYKNGAWETVGTDSVGSGGGGGGTNNANIGSGYRWLNPGTQELRTFFAGLYTTIDSSSNTNGLTVKIDTASMFTALRATIPGGGGGVTTVGTFSGSSQTNGASISGSTITFGPADATNPGMVTTGTQTIAGAKTFTSDLRINKSTPSLDLDATAGNYGYIKIDDAAGQPNYISGETGLTYRTTLSSYKHSFYSNSRLVMQLENQSGLATTGAISMYGQVASAYTGSQGTDKGAFHLERTINDGATGSAHHGFVSKTTFRTGIAAFNSFYAQDVIGRGSANQDHWAGFQTRITKDSANTVSNLYDFVALGSLITGGTATNRYGFYMFAADTSNGATLTNQYGVYIPSLTEATNNYGAYFENNVGIGTATPTEKLQVNGFIKTADPGAGSGSWKLGTFHSSTGLVIDSAGYIEVNIGGTVYWLALAATPFPKPNPKP